MDNKMKIVDFYKDQEIFITGGLGFMGKVLIEKLLRSCPDLKRIFVLIRSRKNESAQQRLEEMIKSPLFDLLKSQNSSALSKLTAVEGDISIDDLGINSKDFELIQNVSIVFHSAASTRFKEPFSKSIMVNTNGTYQLMQLCEKLKNIKVVLHISTTFCNLDQKILEEKVYPPYADWRKIIELSKNSDEKSLKLLTNKYFLLNHNHYTLSKHFAEQIVNDYRTKLPLIIFRPSVVVNTLVEPIAGWTDTLSGPLALAAGVGSGLIRITYTDLNATVEMVAVDVAIKAIIVAAYKKGQAGRENNLVVYNCSKKFDSLYMSKVAGEILSENPFEKCIWNPSNSSTNSRIYFLINFFLFQIIPSIFLDSLLILFRQKPIFMKLQKKIYNGIMAYYPFHSGKFLFNCENTFNLDAEVQISEFEKFGFLQYCDANLPEYIMNSIKGLKLYFFKIPAESTKRAKNLAQFLLFLDYFCKYSILAYILNYLTDLDAVKRVLD